ncbi:F-box/LRR-repeat protein 12-like [Papaver somniferum]|uniref:F-box/LRR-repeat protein 12-like n=1 Tax=Papaver somniferum TaxID=3469 RepID=UPI000E6FF582|nr:F-box/LRR-repeat protein 12-like [Papaver somniferum]
MEEICRDIAATSIMNLPDDCLLHIFQGLDSSIDRDSFGLSCHRWLHIQNTSRRSLQFNSSLTQYTRSTVSQRRPNISSFNVCKLLTRFQQLSSLSLSGCSELPDSSLSQLQFFGSNLQILNLDCCFRISDTGFCLIATGCPNLKSIGLYRCNITDIGLIAVVKSCSSLQRINLSYCTSISDQGIGFLSQECRQLRSVSISHCRSVTGTGFIGCSETLIHVEADSCKLEPDGISGLVSAGGLEHLNLSDLSWCIHGDGLARIGQGSAVNLRVLNLRMCRNATDEAIMMISKGCPILQEWSLAFCHGITLTGWVTIGSNCHNLEVLHVNRCRNLCDRGLQALRDGCKCRSRLHMNHCGLVSQLAIESFKCRRGSVDIREEELVYIFGFPQLNFT